MVANPDRLRASQQPIGGEYEEYHPYGTTAWWGGNVPKRYRYTGKEKDEETGLFYHGARYYAAWLGRWASADPIGLGDGPNRYAYVHGNPVGGTDPTGMATDTELTGKRDAATPTDSANAEAVASGVTMAAWGAIESAPAMMSIIGVSGPSTWLMEQAIGIASPEFESWLGEWQRDIESRGGNADAGAAVGYFGVVVITALPSAEAAGAKGAALVEGAVDVWVGRWLVEGADAAIVHGAKEGSALLQLELRRMQFSPKQAEAFLRAVRPEGFKPSAAIRVPDMGLRYADLRSDAADALGTVRTSLDEVKTGVVEARSRIVTQIEKDAELIRSGQVESVTWHSFENAAGEGGFTEEVIGLLEQAKIRYLSYSQ